MSRSEISARDTDERASNLAQQFGIKTLDKLRQKAKEDMQAAQKEQRLTHREINAYTIATLATDQKIRDDMAHALKSLSAESLDAIRDDHLLINTEKAANALSIMSRSTVLSPKDKATRAQNLAQAYPLASLHVAWQKAKETLLASQKENRPSAQESNAYTIATLAMHQKIQQDHRYAVLQLPDGVPLEISRAAHGTSLTP
jgi:diphthamide synthase (EF-2-diphthine--ammonia ligase)